MAWCWFSNFTKYLLLPRRNLKARYSGGWAVVTGASDGIGKALCIELAKDGFDIVLIARNKEKTEEVAKHIRDTYKVQTQALVFDFSKLFSDAWAAQFATLTKQIKGEVSILVNNVGVCKSKPFHEQSYGEIYNQLNVNINA